MNKPVGIFSIIVAAFGVCFTHNANAAQTAPQPFSTYGNIQNVQKYSSNPFWNPDSPYNLRLPKAIYATGPDVNTGDCNRIVANLITSYCASNDCTNLRINDVRPQIMVQLSQLPGHNFATSCGGYIDGIFEQYQKEHGNTSTVIVKKQNSQIQTTAFPTVTQKPTNVTAERTAELERLQKATTPTPTVTATAFPTTTADLSFTDRLANTSAGYQPYKDLNPYKTPKFEEEYEYWARMKSQNTKLYCQEFPDDEICKEKFKHNITYVTFGGQPEKQSPEFYYTGTGATISWQPTHPNGAFKGWCTKIYTNLGELDNCKIQQTIAPTEDTDKTFYALWECKPGFEKKNHECVAKQNNGGGNGGNGGNNGGNGGNNPVPNKNCSDPLYMSQDCKCTNIPNTHEDPQSHKCVCDNGNDIADDCDAETEFIIADCPARQLRNHLLPQRNKYLAVVADEDSFNTYCINRKETSEKTSSCISHCVKNPGDDQKGGTASNLFQEITGLSMCRSGATPILSTDAGTHFKMTKAKMNEFISALKTQGKDNTGRDLQSTCKRENRTSWVLLIDKLKNGRTAIPYATVCIGGAECTTGEVTWH